ncbi:hypothetical protein [Desulfocastanea catecholica]
MSFGILYRTSGIYHEKQPAAMAFQTGEKEANVRDMPEKIALQNFCKVYKMLDSCYVVRNSTVDLFQGALSRKPE